MLPILANHVILTGYGHWLPNDPRGSGSDTVRKEALRELGELHHGRKREQPSRGTLRQFFREAEPLLEHPVLWFDERCRKAIGAGIETVVRGQRLTMYACAVCANHAHFLVRRHRLTGDAMGRMIAGTVQAFLKAEGLVAERHPVWTTDPWVVFKHDVRAVWEAVGYVERNPVKEGLAPQRWGFVTPYDGWPGKRAMRT